MKNIRLLLFILVSLISGNIEAKEYNTPAYEWRGMMLDISRHFMPYKFLKQQVDLLAELKMNKLHLHLTDNGGWRIEIKKYPRLTQIAAWRCESNWFKWWVNKDRKYLYEGAPGAYGGYYTQQQMRDLVKYASTKGIDVIPEIEMPGHSDEVLAAYPELGCIEQTSHHINLESDVCPSKESTFIFFTDVLKEVMDIFPSKYIHIGGDEAAMEAWKTCELCQAKMKQEHISDVSKLQTLFINRIDSFLNANGRSLIGWDELVTLGNPTKAIPGNPKTIMIWRDSKHALLAIKQGFNVIMAPGRYCYFNNPQDAPKLGIDERTGYLPLKQVYSFNPAKGLSKEEASHLIGLQSCLWTEQIEDYKQAEYMLYPRILAISEIGYKGNKHCPYKQFHKKALKFSTNLRQRGINAFDLSKEQGERPESLRPIKNIAKDAKVIYNKPYSSSYIAQKETTLTDCLLGGWNYGDYRWQGFIGDKFCFDVTIDMGSIKKFKSVMATFMQNAGPSIYLPAETIVSISENGTDFKEISRHTEEQIKKPYLNFKSLGYKGIPLKARYINIKAKAPEQNAWIFTDEVIIR